MGDKRAPAEAKCSRISERCRLQGNEEHGVCADVNWEEPDAAGSSRCMDWMFGSFAPYASSFHRKVMA